MAWDLEATYLDERNVKQALINTFGAVRMSPQFKTRCSDAYLLALPSRVLFSITTSRNKVGKVVYGLGLLEQ